MDGWTTEQLKEYIEKLMSERDRRYEQRFDAQEKAVQKAEQQAADWRASANEWRAAMSDREARFVTRETHGALEQRVSDLKSGADTGLGRATGLNAGWLKVLGVVTLLGGLLGLIGFIASVVRP